MKIDKEEFYAFVQSMVGMSVHDQTVFFDGVSLSGLDAEQMMIQIAEKYGTDLSRYDSAMYHVSDGELTNFLLPLWNILKDKSVRHSSFTALHLFHVLEAGRWFPPTD